MIYAACLLCLWLPLLLARPRRLWGGSEEMRLLHGRHAAGWEYGKWAAILLTICLIIVAIHQRGPSFHDDLFRLRGGDPRRDDYYWVLDNNNNWKLVRT